MLASFIKSILAYGKAFRLIRELKLWFYVFVPGFISLLFGGLAVWLIFQYADNIGEWITSWYRWRGEGVVDAVGSILVGIIIALIAFLAFKHVVLVVVSPFMSPLSEKIEGHLAGQRVTHEFKLAQFAKNLLRGLRLALRNIMLELLYTFILLGIGVVFPVISPFTTIFIFVIQAYYAGFGNMDYTMERHFNFNESIAFVRKNKGLAIGNGIIFLWLFISGIGFLFAPPLATIAATLETVKKVKRLNN